MRQRRACAWQYRYPLSPQERTGVIKVRINMHHFDPKLPSPLAANSPFECCVGATRRFGITGPEHDHLAILETVAHLTVGFEGSVSHAISVVMHCAPVPSFPTIRIDHHLGVADSIHEPKI